VTPSWVLLALRGFFAVLSLVAPRTAGRLALKLFCTPRTHHRPGWETHVADAGARVRVGPHLSARTFGSGPIVLLVHGWEGRGTQLGRFVEPLMQAGFRVIALDLPAHGESAGTRTDLIECTEALRKAGRDLGPLAGVVTHSFGGAITTLALERGLAAQSVVLIASPSSIHDVLRRFEGLIGLGAAAARAFRTAIERQTRVKLEDVEIFERVAGLQVPALIVHDRGDREVPFHDAERLAARWPNATLLATDHLGHRRILKDEHVIRQSVAFIEQRTANAEPEPEPGTPNPNQAPRTRNPNRNQNPERGTRNAELR
jgi:pimeloyl-ACP methyl ester carboxylesterase